MVEIGLWVMHAVCCHHLSKFDISPFYFTEIPVNDIETLDDNKDSWQVDCSYPILKDHRVPLTNSFFSFCFIVACYIPLDSSTPKVLIDFILL